jgi:hypothetical protein
MHTSVQPLLVSDTAESDAGSEPSPNPFEQEHGAFLISNPPVPKLIDPYTAENRANTDEENNGAFIGGVAIASALFFLLVVGGVYRIRSKRKRKGKAMLDSSILRDGRLPITWGTHGDLDDDAPTMMVEVRNSTTGGWHGFYGEDQLQSIDFGSIHSGEQKDDYHERQSLIIDGGLEEIESTNYGIGDLDVMSDEDLVKAYHDAMAIDVESEDEVDFAMQGVGSPLAEKEHHEIT